MRGIILILATVLLLGCVQEAPQEQQPQSMEVPVTEAPETTQPAETQPVTQPVETQPVEETSALSALRQKEYSVRTTDSWDIYFTLYYSKEEHDVTAPDTAVVLVHQLGSDRSDYDELVPLLHEGLPTADIIAMDWRGHGKSTAKGSYQQFGSADYKLVKRDIEAIKSKLGVLRPSIKKYYIMGISLGSSIALDYAQEHGEVDKLVMISPGVAYHNYDIREDMEGYLHELYIATASEDRYSMSSANELYSLSPSDNKELMIYYGMSEHGTALFDATADDEEPLLPLVISWMKR